MTLAPRALTATVLIALALTSCGADAGTDDPQPSAESTPTDEAPQRTTALAELSVSEFVCECVSTPAGANSEGLIAVARDLATFQGGGDAPMVSVLDSSGAVLWEEPIQPATTSGVPTASFVTTEAAIAAPVAEGMRGFGWDGAQLWTLPGDGPIEPKEVPGSDDLVIVSSILFELNGFDSHPNVTLIDAATGEVRWHGEDVDDYTFDADAGELFTARYAADGAALSRVDLETGTETTATVPTWLGEDGTSLSADGDLVTAYLGPAGGNVELAVSVGEVAGDTFPVTEAETPAPDDETGLPEGVERVDSDDDLGLVLGAQLGADGLPETAVLYDAGGTELWQKPAAEVLNWRAGGEASSASGVQLVDGGEYGGPLAVVSRVATVDGPDAGAIADTEAAAHTVLDALTGEELWSWGDKSRLGSLEVSAEAGVALAVQSSSGDMAAPTPGELDVQALDLRTGEADWVYADDPVEFAAVYPVANSMLVIPREGPWLVTSVTERADG